MINSKLLLVLVVLLAGTVIGAEPTLRATAEFTHHGLLINFDQAMRTWPNERMDGIVRLEPAADAACSWNSDTALFCSLGENGSFNEATRYLIHICEGLETQQGEVLPALDLVAETARPTLSATDIEWMAGKPTILIYASANSEAESIASVLRLTIDGEPVPLPALVHLSEREPWEYRDRYRLQLPDVDDHDRYVEVSVIPGLRSRRGPLLGQQDELLLSVLVNERFGIREVRCSGQDAPIVGAGDGVSMDVTCIPGEPIQLLFSQPPHADTATNWLKRLPRAVTVLDDVARAQHEFDHVYPRQSLRRAPAYQALLQIDRAASTTVIRVPDALRSESGEVFTGPSTITIHTGEPRPQLRSAATNTLIADGHRLPRLAEALNAPKLEFYTQAVGDAAHSGHFDVRENRRSKPVAVSSAETRRALADGGWARWQYLGSSRYGQRSVLQFAAPHFNLFAMSGQNEVLVWAVAWNGSDPVAGAEVELLWLPDMSSAPAPVTKGTTSDDGTVRLHLPDDFIVGTQRHYGADGPMWLVRAAVVGERAGASRAVLTLGGIGGANLGKPVSVRLWGVTDRPIYRAGDTVHYRLWAREQQGRRLIAPRLPRTLNLRLAREYYDETLVALTAEPDTNGTIVGEVRLPLHAPDDDYCIGIGERYEIEGACFYVGTYRAQDLWSELAVDDKVLRDGDLLVVRASAGYYSGGSAAGVTLKPTTMLTGLPLGEAYPVYAGYHFIDVMTEQGEAGIPLPAAESAHLIADERGLAEGVWPIAFEPDYEGGPLDLPAFGRLQVMIEAKLSEREGTISPTASTRYTRYDRFVGLRLKQPWLDAGSDVELEAVVIDADGQLDPDAVVEVEVAQGMDDSSEPLAYCRVTSGQSGACAFEREPRRHYTFTAKSHDAAPAVLTRYVWSGAAGLLAAESPSAELQQLSGAVVPGKPVRLLLQQPYGRAWALIVIDGPSGWRHWVQAIDDPVTTLTLETGSDWTGKVRVKTFILERDASAASPRDRHRKASKILEAELEFEIEDDREAPMRLAFKDAQAAPGSTVRLILQNLQDRPRQVVLAVVDDAVRALAGDRLSRLNPLGPSWLGDETLQSTHWTISSFSAWSQSTPLMVPLPWPSGSDGLPYSVQAYGDGYGGLDRVEVVGSRIKRVEVFPVGIGVERMHGLRPRERSTLPNATAVRSRFLDAALWRPDLVLGPGESRSFEVELPDNLTRWRAIAWNSDADDDFAMTEATIEVGQPLEVRVQAPVRIYPDDRARVAANVRSTLATTSSADVQVTVESAEGQQKHVRRIPLAALNQASTGIEIRPRSSGGVQTIVQAALGPHTDAVGAAIEVASPVIQARKVQAGWLADGAIELRMPELPEGAAHPQLRISVYDGSAGLLRRWLGDMRDYPHRCWEQILSRAVAAAIAIETGETALWPNALDVVTEALENAPFFQDEEGHFRYFIDQGSGLAYENGDRRSIALTAYSADAFAFLRRLGHTVNPVVEGRTRTFLAGEFTGSLSEMPSDEAAMTAVVGVPLSDGHVQQLWNGWPDQSRRAQIAITRVLAARDDERTPGALERLLAGAPRRGVARSLGETPLDAQWMGSSLSVQCALIELLQDFPRLDPDSRLRTELLAGITDLYAGGASAIDTQAGAQCLRALLGTGSGQHGAAARSVRLRIDGQSAELTLASNGDEVEWRPLVGSGGTLRIEPTTSAGYPLSYVAELSYQEDARRAQASAVGLHLERAYEVLRDGRWQSTEKTVVREGDWIRITLVIDTGAQRHFVAVTDELPGGLQPVDLALEGVAGVDVQRIADSGSYWFETRRLDARQPRFYAESLPNGRHRIHYFARATSRGDYLAPPATVELMYGKASTARTAMARVRIAESILAH